MSRNQSDIAYDHLRQKIFNRELIPGSKVRYGPVGKEIGMSATPIREAIGRLAMEGLVELVPQSGAMVKNPTREDATEVYEMREAIEPFAAAKACPLIGVTQIKSLQATLTEMKKVMTRAKSGKTIRRQDAASFDQADLKFHLTILEAANNHQMFKAVGDFHLLTGIIGADRHDYDTDVLEMTISDHTAILKGLTQRKPEQAHSAMQTHIRNSRQQVLSVMLPGPKSSFTFPN